MHLSERRKILKLCYDSQHLLYVDDIVITASTDELLRRLTQQLHAEFAMTDLGTLSFFLGISVTRTSSSMVLSQRQYALDLLQRAGMIDCHPY